MGESCEKGAAPAKAGGGGGRSVCGEKLRENMGKKLRESMEKKLKENMWREIEEEYGERKREKAVNSKETLQILEEEQNKKLLQKAFVESFLTICSKKR